MNVRFQIKQLSVTDFYLEKVICTHELKFVHFPLKLLLHSRHISPIIPTLPLGCTRPYCDLVSTPVSSYWLSSHHTFPYPAVPSSFYVTGFLSYSESSPVKMGPIRCPETSVNNYHTTTCNNSEDHRFHKFYVLIIFVGLSGKYITFISCFFLIFVTHLMLSYYCHVSWVYLPPSLPTLQKWCIQVSVYFANMS
jgi:hypothetical protein